MTDTPMNKKLPQTVEDIAEDLGSSCVFIAAYVDGNIAFSVTTKNDDKFLRAFFRVCREMLKAAEKNPSLIFTGNDKIN